MEESSNGEDHIIDDGGDDDDDETGSFQLDKSHMGGIHYGDACAAMAEYENTRGEQFDTSEYFDALENDYYEALEKKTRKPPSITFAEENDLIFDDDRHRRTSNLDIFDEGKDNIFDYNDDNESIYETMLGDKDSMDDSDDDEAKKIRRGILYGAGGAAVMAGFGYVAKKVVYGFQNTDDVDGGVGTDMFGPNGTDQTVTMSETGADVAHAAELAADLSTASMNTSCSEILVAGTAGNVQGAAAGAAQ
jgi:hypothetical protein